MSPLRPLPMGFTMMFSPKTGIGLIQRFPVRRSSGVRPSLPTLYLLDCSAAYRGIHVKSGCPSSSLTPNFFSSMSVTARIRHLISLTAASASPLAFESPTGDSSMMDRTTHRAFLAATALRATSDLSPSLFKTICLYPSNSRNRVSTFCPTPSTAFFLSRAVATIIPVLRSWATKCGFEPSSSPR